ncbi:L,D-transpeptidase [Candidatus Uhrbacteria bacterium]|nr:L,D-transpeptidase [Candidatus Uhrbacteria bacterium]
MHRAFIFWGIAIFMIGALAPQFVFAARGTSPQPSPQRRGEGEVKTIRDLDRDGLTDDEEKVLGTDPRRTDTDGDGYSDRLEIMNGYSPLDPAPKQTLKKIVIDIKTQRLSYFVGKKKMGTFKISTGTEAMPTPYGVHKILNKTPRAWSGLAKLWMPWWMAFKGSKYGIHELPEWPGGKKEGADHLGKRVSHGCVRLGVGPAKKLYDWAEVGTIVIVQ